MAIYIKNVHICSIEEFKRFLREGEIDKHNSFALISTSYPEEMFEVSNIRYSFEYYDDIDYFVLGKAFTYEGAQRFARAITANSHIKHWWCVCDDGKRRSSATACALLRFFGNESEELKIWRDPSKSPNPLVYEMLCKALDVPVASLDLELRIYETNTTLNNSLRRDE